MADVAVAEDQEAPPEAEGAEGEEEAQSGLGKKKLIIFGAIGLVVLIGLGAAAYFLFFSGGDAETEGAAVEEVIPTYFYDLPEMLVNLSTEENAEDQFLKLSVSLEVSDEAMFETIEMRVTPVLDAFQVYLRELRRTDLEGSAGIYRLKEELRRRVNLAIFPAEVDNILFKEILVQ